VIVPVPDQDRAIAFSVDTLGLEKRADIPFGGQTAGNAQTGIALHTEDIDLVHAELHSRGVDADEEISRMGDPVPPMFWLRDPDNNTLRVVETR
jgi:catechol 2,3-dioxygenase-like lactoylglutathione lyase family enzyme